MNIRTASRNQAPNANDGKIVTADEAVRLIRDGEHRRHVWLNRVGRCRRSAVGDAIGHRSGRKCCPPGTHGKHMYGSVGTALQSRAQNSIRTNLIDIRAMLGAAYR